MNILLNQMANDMFICRYDRETDFSFVYRIIYSALGLWCLKSGLNVYLGVRGETKGSQTIFLNELMEKLIEQQPDVSSMFHDNTNEKSNFSVHVRRIYEETGYFLVDINNQNLLANYGRSVEFAEKSLFFGIPDKMFTIRGLGIFIEKTKNSISINDFLIRDRLIPNQYILSQYDANGFQHMEHDFDQIQYYNPKSLSSSSPWTKDLNTNFSVSRNIITNSHHKVLRDEFHSVLYSNEIDSNHDDSFTSNEYRRLYFALKQYYNNPIIAYITNIDEMYSKIEFSNYLPNREYYLMLLISWPFRNAFDKSQFLVHNDLICDIACMLTNIGIKVKEKI